MLINLLLYLTPLPFFLGIILGLKFKKALVFWPSLIIFLLATTYILGYSNIPKIQLGCYMLQSQFYGNPYIPYVLFLIIFISILLICLGLFIIEICRRSGKNLLVIVLIVPFLILSMFLSQYILGNHQCLQNSPGPPSFQQVCISAPLSVGCRRSSDV